MNDQRTRASHSPLSRPLGTMIAYGFSGGDVEVDLEIAARLKVSLLEILPDWKRCPEPGPLRDAVWERGFRIHSVHACWGTKSIRAQRVDLASAESTERMESLDDVKRCADWLFAVGGTHLVIHPGGLSEVDESPRRRAFLLESLVALADHVSGTPLRICVENMPPGVHPGSRMKELADLLMELDRSELALALDTGHAHLSETPANGTLAAGARLGTTHVHDNDGRRDTHLPPGMGTIDWDAWIASLDVMDYRGPIMLECIRYLRQNRKDLNDTLLARLQRLTRQDRDSNRDET